MKDVQVTITVPAEVARKVKLYLSQRKGIAPTFQEFIQKHGVGGVSNMLYRYGRNATNWQEKRALTERQDKMVQQFGALYRAGKVSDTELKAMGLDPEMFADAVAELEDHDELVNGDVDDLIDSAR